MTSKASRVEIRELISCVAVCFSGIEARACLICVGAVWDVLSNRFQRGLSINF